MGLVGKNGAGKTTTIKLIFDLLQKENGLIKILGNDTANNYDFKQNVAVVFDDLFFVDDWNIDDVEKAFSPFYGRWNKNEFQSYLNKFNLNIVLAISFLSVTFSYLLSRKIQKREF